MSTKHSRVVSSKVPRSISLTGKSTIVVGGVTPEGTLQKRTKASRLTGTEDRIASSAAPTYTKYCTNSAVADISISNSKLLNQEGFKLSYNSRVKLVLSGPLIKTKTSLSSQIIIRAQSQHAGSRNLGFLTNRTRTSVQSGRRRGGQTVVLQVPVLMKTMQSQTSDLSLNKTWLRSG
jgi:hypothetical protein